MFGLGSWTLVTALVYAAFVVGFINLKPDAPGVSVQRKNKVSPLHQREGKIFSLCHASVLFPLNIGMFFILWYHVNLEDDKITNLC